MRSGEIFWSAAATAGSAGAGAIGFCAGAANDTRRQTAAKAAAREGRMALLSSIPSAEASRRSLIPPRRHSDSQSQNLRICSTNLTHHPSTTHCRLDFAAEVYSYYRWRVCRFASYSRARLLVCFGAVVLKLFSGVRG